MIRRSFVRAKGAMTSLDLQILHKMNIDFDTVHYCSRRVVPRSWIQLRRMSHELQFFYHTIAYVCLHQQSHNLCLTLSSSSDNTL